MSVIKVAKTTHRKKYKKNAYLSMKPTRRYIFLLFHSYNPKQKWNLQMASRQAKARSTQGQRFVKYRVIIIFIKKTTIVNTSDLKIFQKKCPNISRFFQDVFP